MQHLGANFGGSWKFELGFFIWFLWVFLLKKYGLIFKSPMATPPPTPQAATNLYHVVDTHILQCHFSIRLNLLLCNASKDLSEFS